MNKIHQLPHDIVAKIAAGEVIERPVFAVKELVENSIDANADAITVLIEESGLKKITVSDNGEGMSNEDLKESFKSHTTSKLSKQEELTQVKTLGFRGEALASIAAVSKMTIASRVSDASIGTSISIKNGVIEKISPIGMPAGTTIDVDHLFHSLPARKKFLKSLRTEFRHILDLLIGYALSYPEIHFVLIHNKKTIFDLPKTDLLYRIEKLLGKDMYSSLLPVEYNNSYVSVTGFVAKPTFTTKAPGKQFLFINNRLVTDKGISLSLKSAYGELLSGNVYPVCILSFSLPFEMVDVNVHPRKEYVKFADTSLLYDAIKQAILKTFASYDLMPDAEFTHLFLSDAVGSTESYAGKLLKEKKFPWELPAKIETDYSQLLQLHNLYLLVSNNTGFILIDQHAAHERILYEQFLREFSEEKKKRNVFHFPKPGIFDLGLSETELLLEHLEMFHELGWDIEHFKNTTFVLRSLPVLFQDRDYIVLLKEILEDLQNDNKHKLDSITKKMIAYLACRGAVKAGDKLDKKQMKELIEQLEKTKNNATCPHGRPTRISIELEKINRLFKRK
jgi:DNA mismatch repair protein MutL